jgi:phosphoglycerol geranylgeranyltransferase
VRLLKLGRVERELRRRVEAGEKLFLLLSDPEKPLSPETVERLSSAGVDALLVGGSLNVTPYDIDEYVERLRSAGVRLPVIIFPGGLNNIARSADAILFMTLMNSVDPYWLAGAQVAAAPIVRRLGLEVIPTTYVIVGYGGAAGHIGRAMPIPYETPYIAAAYALAGAYLGSHLVYLEAGSGAPQPVPVEAVSLSRRVLDDQLLIVGGGIRSPEAARERLEAGADGIVVGTLAERDPEKTLAILSTVKKR